MEDLSYLCDNLLIAIMKTIAVINEYTHIFNESISLLNSVVSLQNPDLTRLEILEQGANYDQRGDLYRKIKNIQWEDLLGEMNYNAEPYTFSSYWTHYKRQFDYLFSQFNWEKFRDDDYDFMDEENPIFQHYFAQGDAEQYGVVCSFIRLLVQKVSELEMYFSNSEKYLCDFNTRYSFYENININQSRAEEIYNRLLDKDLLEDVDQGKEIFVYRFKGKGKDNLKFIPTPLRWKGSNILLYMLLDELIGDADGCKWQKTSCFFVGKDEKCLTPHSINIQLQQRKDTLKKAKDKPQYMKEKELISYILTGKTPDHD